MVKLYIENEQDKIPYDEFYADTVRRAVEATLGYEGVSYSCEVSVTFVDNERIRELNSEYRNIDRETDVLSFPTGDTGEGVTLGDVVISLEKAKAQAEEYGHSLEREIAFLTVHSVLHLLGYDHETGEEDEKEMFRRQDEIMDKLGITRG